MSKSRYRPSAGHIMLELLYGKADYIQRTTSTTINISKMAKGMHMRPVRLIGCLKWLEEQSLVSGLDVRRYEASMVTRPIEGSSYNILLDEASFYPPCMPVEYDVVVETGRPEITSCEVYGQIKEGLEEAAEIFNNLDLGDIEPVMARTREERREVIIGLIDEYPEMANDLMKALDDQILEDIAKAGEVKLELPEIIEDPNVPEGIIILEPNYIVPEDRQTDDILAENINKPSWME